MPLKVLSMKSGPFLRRTKRAFTAAPSSRYLLFAKVAEANTVGKFRKSEAMTRFPIALRR